MALARAVLVEDVGLQRASVCGGGTLAPGCSALSLLAHVPLRGKSPPFWKEQKVGSGVLGGVLGTSSCSGLWGDGIFHSSPRLSRWRTRFPDLPLYDRRRVRRLGTPSPRSQVPSLLFLFVSQISYPLISSSSYLFSKAFFQHLRGAESPLLAACGEEQEEQQDGAVGGGLQSRDVFSRSG